MKCKSQFVAAMAATFILGYSSLANASMFLIDESESFITMDIIAIVDIASPQIAGSDSAVPTGSIMANRVGGLNGTIEFTPGTFDFLNFPMLLEPAEYADGVTVSPAPVPPGEAMAQYGFDIDVLGGAIVGQAALRALTGELTSGVLDLTAGDFDSTLVDLGIPTGHADYSLVGPGIPLFGVPAIDEAGGSDVEDLVATNTGAGGMLSVAGLIETLTMPIDLTIVTELGGVEVSLVATGQIVATRVIPEPGTFTLLGAGLVGLVAVGRHRWRRKG
jgi:hypothetical protein